MYISLYSIVMGILFFNVSVILIFIFRRNIKFIQSYGTALLLFLILLTVARIVLPWEFSFTREINSDSLYPMVQDWLRHSVKIPIIHVTANRASAVISIGLLISCFLFVRDFIQYNVCYKKIIHMPSLITEHINKLFIEVKDGLDVGKKDILLIQNESIHTPQIIGFFKPVILLPQNSFTDKQLRFIFAHEVTHYKNKDIWLKLLVNIICNFFWWNPFVYLLKMDLAQILEIRCDLNVCKQREIDERKEYLYTIIEIIKSNKKPVVNNNYYSSELVKKYISEENLKQRFKIVLVDDNKKTMRLRCGFIYFIAVLCMLSSYSVILQPYYVPQIDKNELIVDKETSTIIYNSADNTYMLFINNEFSGYISKAEVEQLELIDVISR